MKKLLSLVSICFVAVLIFSCGNNGNADEKVAVKGDTLDHVIDLAISEKHQNLDPITISDINTFQISSQIFESLIRFDNTNSSLQPSIADSWVVSENGLVYTFSLRKKVYFQDNDCFDGGKGREVNANDVVYSFKRVCTNRPNNFTYNLFKDKIKGVVAFHNSKKEFSEKNIEGIKAIDNYTVEFTLTHPSSQFLQLLATINTSIVAKEAIENNVIVGTGPFMYDKSNDSDTKTVLSKNTNYYLKDKEGNRLPYIDGVSFTVVPLGQKRLDDFMSGKLDIITAIPPAAIKKLVEAQISAFQDKPEKYFLGRNKELATSYLNFNTVKAPLNNIKIRQAIAYAINKTKLVDDVLKGEAYGPADYGFVPPAIRNYDFSSVVGKEFNVAKAQQLLADAGFKNGKGFPSLKLTTSQTNSNLRVALFIQKQLKANLNINIEIISTSLAEVLKINRYATGDITLLSWVADYPDALNFLVLCYGKNIPKSLKQPSYPNSSRYNNPKFNQLYKEAASTLKENKKNDLCLAADQIIANDVPILPLWYHERYILIQTTVKNFVPNPMLIQYLVNVKIEKVQYAKKKDNK